MLQIILKYGPLLLKYAAVIRFLPLVSQLWSLIRTAERDFKGAGAGPERAKWVAQQFRALVDLLDEANVLDAKLCEVLRDGAEQFVELAVRLMKASGGIEPAPPTPTPGTSFPYSDVLYTFPDRSLLVHGDEIYQEPTGQSQWIVWGRIGSRPDSWHLIETIA